MVPNDPVILLSYVNTKLRDEYPSLEELCSAEDIDPAWLTQTLAAIDYRYQPEQNKFV